MSIYNNTDKQQQPPDLSDVHDELKRDIHMGFNAIQIGIIEKFDSAKQLATIRLAIKHVRDIAPDGTKTLVEHPLILECPVMVLFGGVDFLSMPITVGDSCIVLFCDRDIDYWLYNGGVNPPNTYRTHDNSDAIAIVGINSLQKSIATFLANGIRLSHGGGNAKIDFTDNLIASLATLFTHTGNMQITGDLTILGTTYGNSGSDWNIHANIRQDGGHSIHAGNGATGTFNIVTVVDGIVTGGS